MPPGPGRVDALFLEFQSALAGRYSLDRELGRGGMGIVYLARDVQLDRPVAIKLLPPVRAMDDALRERFVREARMAARLSHPNIIPIFAVDEVEGFVFYVMAFVDGETLGDRVRARGPLPAGEATRLLREVAWALAHAHAQGVVHRDVKPENILLERATGRALVTDFGIAAAIGADESPAVAGTPEFMSPEQALGGDLDARSDLYGLGATAYFAVSGRAPFTGERAVDVVAKQVAVPAPPVAGAGVTVPRRLAHLIDKCLHKEPAQRPATAQVLAEQLAAVADERREVPAALRAFVKRDGRILGGGGSLVVGYFAIMGTVSLVLRLGPLLGTGAMVSVLVGIPFAGLVRSARQILRRGFTPADVDMAFTHEIAQLREEFVAQGGVERPRVERAANVLAITGLGAVVTALATLVAVGGGGGTGTSLAAWLGIAGGWSVAVGAVTKGILERARPHTAAERWARLWRGRVGRVAFALARALGGRPVAGAATTHRATEMAIGMAADELFASLPKDTRRALGDVPALARRLQRDAMELRTALDGLQEALDQAGPSATGSAYAQTRELRDEIAERHRQAVATLETLRLNLLRLHAGAISVQGFTTEIGQADEVASEVRRLLEARGELERYLRFPAPAADTPA